MRYISIIKNKGWKYFFTAMNRELRKKFFVKKVNIFYKGPSKISFSQYAEDLFIDKILGYPIKGIYIDVGANHPKNLSNTKKFYDRGWRGINVEPNKSNFQLFLNDRRDDVNLNVGVGQSEAPLKFYVFNSHELSTFVEKEAVELQKNGFDLLEVQSVAIMSLSQIFSLYAPLGADFLSIDTEGYDQEVLNSNDWDKYRPKLVCIEDRTGKDYLTFFLGKKYKFLCFNGLNSFFIDTLWRG